MRRVGWTGGVLIAALVGCRFDASGTFESTSLSDDTGATAADVTTDTTTDTGTEPPPVDSETADSGCVGCDTGPTIPPGFNPVTVVGSRAGDAGVDGGTTCPAGWKTPRELVLAPKSGGATCTCTCGVGPNACLHDNFTLNYRTGSSNCNDGTHTVAADGACRALPAWPAGTNGASGTALAPKAKPCPAKSELPPIVDDGAVHVCSPGSAIPPEPSTPVCFLQSGDVACPASASNKRVLVPRDGITDGRGCGDCACTTSATSCANGTVTFANNAACTTGTRTVSINGTCNAISGAGAATHYKYTATPNTTACAPATETVATTGTLALPMTVTLCCP